MGQGGGCVVGDRPRALPAVLLALAVAAVAFTLLGAAPAFAQASAGDQLAHKYAPVLRLVAHPKVCGSGEPYVPMNINRILGNDEVVLRGPWDATNVVKIAPTADDLLHANIGYHLDFPGDALDPGCAYERFSRRAVGDSLPVTYAHIASQSDRPGELALQYWFFYAYNDFNNKHEGDWEMIQLVFDANSPEQALTTSPAMIGYSQHEGAEKANWGDGKLQIVDGTHPVVYPAAGSHANYFDSALWLGRTAQQGVGCDDTRDASHHITPTVAYVPAEPAAYLRADPWLGYRGAWGEKQSWVFNGPTGPNEKYQWTHPISWSDDWRSESVKIPTSAVRLGDDPATLFCRVVGKSSAAFTLWERSRDLVLFILSALVTLLLWLLSRTPWQPSAPLHLARRRGFGQIVFSTGRLYGNQLWVFIHITALLVPIPILITGSSILVNRSAGSALSGTVGVAAGIVGVVLDLLALSLVQVVVALAMERVDAGQAVTFRELFGATRAVAWPAIKTWLVYIVMAIILTATIVGIPIALWLAVRWALAQQVIALEGTRGTRAAFRRSGRLVRGTWIKTALIGVLGAILPEFLGPLVGALAIFAVGVDFELANFTATLAFLCLLPFVAAMRVYLYHDLRVRDALREPEVAAGGKLPPDSGMARAPFPRRDRVPRRG